MRNEVTVRRWASQWVVHCSTCGFISQETEESFAHEEARVHIRDHHHEHGGRVDLTDLYRSSLCDTCTTPHYCNRLTDYDPDDDGGKPYVQCARVAEDALDEDPELLSMEWDEEDEEGALASGLITIRDDLAKKKGTLGDNRD